MSLVMQYASIPIADLRRRGISEQLILFLEANRAALLRIAAAQAKSDSEDVDGGPVESRDNGRCSLKLDMHDSSHGNDGVRAITVNELNNGSKLYYGRKRTIEFSK
ncbi:hypothetical protein FB451DRAFT_1402031 [Mycena latifolia]|nr:hypothetical protein FB451DRAFT_1402031 [Mycena latifolia]